MNEKFEKYQLLLTAMLVGANIFLVAANFFLWRTTREAVQEARRASQGILVAQLNKDFFFNERMYRVRKAIEEKKPILKAHKGESTDQDIEDYIGFLEMVHEFVERKILDCELADDNFGGYVEEASTDKEIRDYIVELRREMNNDELYSGFEEWGKGACKKKK
jgi:hypothetical protein